MYTCGVKFCGGCNPRYDRKHAFNLIKESLKSKYSFMIANENETYDYLLVLSGCQNNCTMIGYLKVNNRTFILSDISQLEDVIKQMNEEVK